MSNQPTVAKAFKSWDHLQEDPVLGSMVKSIVKEAIHKGDIVVGDRKTNDLNSENLKTPKRPKPRQ